jgi:hypothetical protein
VIGLFRRESGGSTAAADAEMARADAAVLVIEETGPVSPTGSTGAIRR